MMYTNVFHRVYYKQQYDVLDHIIHIDRNNNSNNNNIISIAVF